MQAFHQLRARVKYIFGHRRIVSALFMSISENVVRPIWSIANNLPREEKTWEQQRSPQARCISLPIRIEACLYIKYQTSSLSLLIAICGSYPVPVNTASAQRYVVLLKLYLSAVVCRPSYRHRQPIVVLPWGIAICHLEVERLLHNI